MRSKLIAIVGCVAVLVGVVAIGAASTKSKRRQAASRAARIGEQLPILMPKGVADADVSAWNLQLASGVPLLPPRTVRPFLNVEVGKTTTGEVRAAHASVANQMNKANLGMTEHRRNYFTWLRDPNYTVIAWGGFIEDVEPLDGGSLATVRVCPVVLNGGLGIIHGDYTMEKYSLANGEVTFVGGFSPRLSGGSGLH
jgi:hypothetical protein